ncbi:MAG: type II toxin-antitoxin system VapC family toxin [Deltaproteobacteria bacterium]|nr:type II toxin-antitoxin system VapC family toxin [Deltaproteobacteria bacterium]
MIVLDASAAIELLLGTDRGILVASRIAPESETLHAPHLLDLEVAQVLRRYEASGHATADRCKKALIDLSDLDIARYPHDVLMGRVWALRKNMTAYDAVYVALAEALRATLLTCDRRLAAAPMPRIDVEVV